MAREQEMRFRHKGKKFRLLQRDLDNQRSCLIQLFDGESYETIHIKQSMFGGKKWVLENFK
jgi:hypothetical protein